MRLDRRQCLGAVAILALGLCGGCSGGSASPPAAQPKPDPPPPGGPPEAPPPPVADAVTPEQFGAAGDGQTNDTDAFAKMTAAVNKAGGGRVVLRKTTYVVGGHVSDPASGYAFAPANIMVFDGCTKQMARSCAAPTACALEPSIQKPVSPHSTRCLIWKQASSPRRTRP